MKKKRSHKAWELWSRGDSYDEPGFVEAFADKGEARARMKRLKRSHPHVHYMLKRRRVPSRMLFSSRGERRHRAKSLRDTHRFTAAERSGRARVLHGLARKGGTHTYASPEVKRTASYKRAERLEEQLAPKRWNTPGLSRSQYERLADAWERAGFTGWADNYRAHVEQHKIGRDPGRRRVHRHRAKGAPPFTTQKKISRKIRLLVREGYPPKQAAAIAYRMYVRKKPLAASH